MIQHCDPLVLSQIRALVTPILMSEGCEEVRKRRLERLGYALRKSGNTTYLATVPHGIKLLELS